MLFNVYYDFDRDKLSFLTYLLNKEKTSLYPFIRKSILKNFPDLQKIDEFNDESLQVSLVENFIHSLYKKHQKEILDLIDIMRSDFNSKSMSIVEGLMQSMGYDIPQNTEFFIRLTFLPQSTYTDIGANISILNYLVGSPYSKAYMGSIIHEYTHIIYKNKMINLYGDKMPFPIIVSEFLKECIAPVILRQELFQGLIVEQNKYANPAQQYLNIETNLNESNLIDYLCNVYGENIKNEGFDFVLKQYVYLFEKISQQIEDKNKLFNSIHLGENMRSDDFKKKLVEYGYMDPIII